MQSVPAMQGVSSPDPDTSVDANWFARALDRRPTATIGATTGALVLLYGIGTSLPFWFLDTPESGAAFFPAAGLTVALLVLSPRRLWPLWLSLVALTELYVDLDHGLSMTSSSGFAIANTVEPLIGATVLLATIGRVTTMRSQLVRYVTSCIAIGPVAGALVGATTLLAWTGGSEWLETAARWWLGDALGVLIVATPILAWSYPIPFDTRPRPLETTVMVLLATSIAVVPAVQWQQPMIYAVLPVLMWAALRGGVRAVATAGVGLAFAADWAAVTGRADQLIIAADANDRLVHVQVLLGLSLLAALTLAVEVADRRRAEHAVNEAEGERRRTELLTLASVELERRRIARETHDIVGHALNVILLHAAAARRMLKGDVGLANEFLESIESVGRSAFRDLDLALALVGSESDQRAGRGLDDVPHLVEIMRRGGMRIELETVGEQLDLPKLVDWSAFRIVQEALTNVARYARPPRAAVSIHLTNGEAFIDITDDGVRRAGPVGHGSGIAGMRERAALAGGRLDAGPSPDGLGWRVHAVLPAPKIGAGR
jgi:signal transduction histidine kinase